MRSTGWNKKEREARKEIIKFILDEALRGKKNEKKEKTSSLHQLRSRNAHLLCCIPNLCHSSAEAMYHSGQGNRYRILGELNSNQQHIYDIYHTPARHFSAISCCVWPERRGRKKNFEYKKTFSDNNKLLKNLVQLFYGVFFSHPHFSLSPWGFVRVSCTLNKEKRKASLRGLEHAVCKD